MAFHGGRSFEAIGVAFDHLERAQEVVSADVLDAWFDLSPRVLERRRDYLPFLARTSPPVRAAGLLQVIAKQRGIDEDCILTGGGSSDLIFACLPHMINASGTAMIRDPMYGEYRYVLEEVMGVDLVEYPLSKASDYLVDTEAIAAAVRKVRPELVIVVNPNSPTGQHWRRCNLLRFLDNVPVATTVVVDETYIEYVGSEESLERVAATRPNLVVLKSMSKAYALSGMRAGYLVANPSTIRRLGLWIPPWSISLPAQLAAVEALNDPDYYKERYRETGALREQFEVSACCEFGLKIHPSEASFLLVETAMSGRNVFVRNCDSMSRRFHVRFIRIAVKRHGENERIVGALEAVTGR